MAGVNSNEFERKKRERAERFGPSCAPSGKRQQRKDSLLAAGHAVDSNEFERKKRARAEHFVGSSGAPSGKRQQCKDSLLAAGHAVEPPQPPADIFALFAEKGAAALQATRPDNISGVSDIPEFGA